MQDFRTTSSLCDTCVHSRVGGTGGAIWLRVVYALHQHPRSRRVRQDGHELRSAHQSLLCGCSLFSVRDILYVLFSFGVLRPRAPLRCRARPPAVILLGNTLPCDNATLWVIQLEADDLDGHRAPAGGNSVAPTTVASLLNPSICAPLKSGVLAGVRVGPSA